MTQTIISVQNLSHAYTDSQGTTAVLSDINFTLQAGQSLALMGASGSGKTTLLSMLAGLDSPTSGTVEVLGQNLSELNAAQRASWRAGRVGFVFQNFQLVANLSALENVQMALELAQPKAKLAELKAQASAALAQVGLSHRLNQAVTVLSGGEQQRVAIARALVVQPQVLFADEPTGSLDYAAGQSVEQLLFSQVKERGISLVLVTHDAALAAKCDRQLRIVKGSLA